MQQAYHTLSNRNPSPTEAPLTHVYAPGSSDSGPISLKFNLYKIYLPRFIHGIHTQAYIPKRRTLIQVLPPANAYTKSAND